MKSKTNNRSIAIRPTEAVPDPAVLQADVEQRLAFRFGVSLPVAAVLSSLAGIGPQTREARR
ncbi:MULTISPECIES: hypothetical protein [unclassified Methylobacterium]|uniref:hypothetical protein n=1 Tax=unclassified Methylobacterium TaxID=2615210 RepID=UPI001FB964E0|nr:MULTISPECIES: hypothetical protein [unclassified Methylobacterium]MCJ2093955.1 hypothetical protein [Methylobacterium sp. J-072]MCJ2142935.1 hypothetical protein [Methylobacterium sp. E-066]